MRSTLDQEDQEIHRLSPELYRTASATQLIRSRVELEVAESQCRRRAGRAHFG